MRPGPHQKRQVAVGALLIAALTAIALSIFFLDEIGRLTERPYRIFAIFPDANRLQKGTPVRIAGNPVGSVQHVGFLPPAADSTARITAILELPLAVRTLVRRDSELRLVPDRMLGRAVVDLTPGTPAAPPLLPGDTLRARRAADIEGLRVQGTRFVAELDSLLAAARTVDALAADRAPAFRQVTREIEAARFEFERLVGQLEGGPLAGFLHDPARDAAIDRLREAADRIARILRTDDRRTATAALRPALERLARRAELLRDRIDRLEALLGERRGMLPRMRYDTALTAALDGVRAQLDSLVIDAKKGPWRFVF